MTNRVARIHTHNLRRNQGRLSRLRSIDIWQLQVRQPSSRCFTFHFCFFLFLPGTLFTVSLGLPQSKNNHSKSNLSGSMSKKKKDWKTEKGKACFFSIFFRGGNKAIIATMTHGMNSNHARRLTRTQVCFLHHAQRTTYSWLLGNAIRWLYRCWLS